MKIEIIELKKILLIDLESISQTITTMDFIAEYHMAVSKIRCKDYTLIVDATNLSTFRPDTFQTLGRCYKLYMSNGFHKMFIINPIQETCKMQLHSIAKATSFTGVFVNNIDEIIKN